MDNKSQPEEPKELPQTASEDKKTKDPVKAETKKEEKKKGRKKEAKEPGSGSHSGRKWLKRIMVALMFVTFSAVAAAYITIAIYYQTHFFPHTEIEGMDCGNADAIAVEMRIKQQSWEYALEIIGRDQEGKRETIGVLRAEDMDYELESVEQAVTEVLEGQNEWLWITRLFDDTAYSYDFTFGVTFDGDKLAEALSQMSACQKKNMIRPKDAYISEYSEALKGYEIVPETQGTVLNMEAVLGVVEAAVYGNAKQVDLTQQGCYVEAAVTSEDKELLANVADANRWLEAEISYDWNGSEVVVDRERIRQWVSIQDNAPVLDEEAIAEFVAEQAKEFDTYGKKRKFTTVQGTELSLPGGAYGWKTDRAAEAEELAGLIKRGVSVEREPVYVSKGAAKGKNDIGSSYVEIDMTNQHLYLYQRGNIVLETDFVSGNMSNGCMTPPGVFGITYKTKNAVLRGADYVTPVNYWMPFNGNVGMHDATWRSEFGGEIYLTNGSHGCINLPLDMAAAIYEYMSEGFPVICYYY